MLELALDQLAGVKLFAIDPARPVTGREKPHQVELTGLQGLELGGVVFVNFDCDPVKIAHAAPHIEVFGPVSRITHISDVFAKTHRAHAVRAAAYRYVHHHGIKALGLTAFHAPAAAEHRQAAHRERQFPVGLFKAVAQTAFAQNINAGNVFQQGFVSR